MRRVIAPVLAFLFCLFGLKPVEALNVAGLSVTLTCSTLSYGSFAYTFDRDNTGTGQEAYQIIVKDSADNVIHLASGEAYLSGPIGEPGATDTPYNIGTAVPGAVTYQWISLAGNGLEEQTAYSVTGYCGDAPTVTPTLTPTPTVTPGPSPTPVPTATSTLSPVVYSTMVFGGQAYEVAFKLEVTPGDFVQVAFLVVISGLLMTAIFLYARRGR